MINFNTKNVTLDQSERSRYARHLSLPEVGIEGQKRLKSASVLCVGTGGLGSPILLYLAAAGIGKIGIVDFDVVDESNLQRQIIHGTSKVGLSKTLSAKDSILEINPYCKVEIHNAAITSSNALNIFKDYDIICDGTDNFPARYLINDACIILGKPNVYGSIIRFEGHATVFNLDDSSPNYRDLFPSPLPPEMTPSCAEDGVIGVLPGIIGVIQATEVIKIITGIGKPLSGRLLLFNALEMKFNEIQLKADPNTPKITKLIDYNQFYGHGRECSSENETEIEIISFHQLKSMLISNQKQILLVDVRSPEEAKIDKIPGSVLIPLKELMTERHLRELSNACKDKTIIVYCKTGLRSAKAVKALSKKHIHAKQLQGGITAWNVG
ncbi:molybdopterin-synthase adenylyltransferase MoeB [bacterium]|nr:molybdopterin-synthase adenylyltransferase MoeB [bacterium]